MISKYLKSNDWVTCDEPDTILLPPNTILPCGISVNSEPSPLNPTDELTFASKTNESVASSHFNDLLAPAISNPAPSAWAEFWEPLATVINLSSIVNSEVPISVAAPNTVKSPVIVTSPLAVISLNNTFDVVLRFWFIVSSSVLFECVWETPSRVSNLESKDVETDVPTNKSLTWSEPLTTPPFKSADIEPLVMVISIFSVSSEEETIFVPPVTTDTSTWDEPLITPSVFNLSFTLESKFKIESAFTWSEPLNNVWVSLDFSS